VNSPNAGGTSYLAAHTFWLNRDSNTLCQYCEEDDETFDYAIRYPSTKTEDRLSHLSEIENLGSNSILWSFVLLLMKVPDYISATQTRFPPSDFEVPDPPLAGSPRAEPAVLSDSNSSYSAWADRVFPYYFIDTFSLVLVFITW